MNIGHTIYQPPFGFVRLVSVHGTDLDIVRAARVSYGEVASLQDNEKNKRLLFRLYKDRHTSPFEQVSMTFNIKFPIFLMRQFVRHRTARLNEFSARYKELPDQFFLPRQWRAQEGPANHQGSVPDASLDQHALTKCAEHVYNVAYETYKDMLNMGASREQARMVLPVGIYTEIVVNIDLHNLTHFLRLRCDPHAQEEIREVAGALKEMAKGCFPWVMEAYDRYVFKVHDSLDSAEMLALAS